MSSEHLQLEK